MEQLLFVLFVLFSVVSALLERRKRKKQREEQETSTPLAVEDKEEDEAWPFPMGGDPFEPTRPRRQSARSQETEDHSEPSVVPAGNESVAAELSEPKARKRPRIFQRLEEFAQEAERRSREEDERIRAEYQPARHKEQEVTEVLPPQRVQELVRARVEEDEKQTAPRREQKKRRWRLTAKTTRNAVVYAEILGRPKALREQELFG